MAVSWWEYSGGETPPVAYGFKMTRPLRILMIVHGFPPRETAGTEQHVFQLGTALRERGHAVHVLAATRSHGAPQYSVQTLDGVTRVVNNLTTRRLADGESDPAIDTITAKVVADFQPDIVHVHHIQFLSSTMRFDSPVIITLHDRWGWCAAGGLGLLADGRACEGPNPQRCAPCAAAWRPTPGAIARGMTRTAQLLQPLISADKLHSLYRSIPTKLRPRPHRGVGPQEPAAAARHRNQTVGAFYRSAQMRISPSQHLAREAEAQGLGPTQVIPHGIPAQFASTSSSTRSGFVHIGSIAHHKGTDRVVRAWRSAFPEASESLSLHGPVVDLQAALGHPIGPTLDRAGVARTLASARALVLAPRWSENAPLVVLEARATGCPVIAPDTGGFPEMITPGTDGWLFEPDDPEGLTTAMREAARGPLPTPSQPPSLSEQVDATEAAYLEVLDAQEVPCA